MVRQKVHKRISKKGKPFLAGSRIASIKLKRAVKRTPLQTRNKLKKSLKPLETRARNDSASAELILQALELPISIYDKKYYELTKDVKNKIIISRLDQINRYNKRFLAVATDTEVLYYLSSKSAKKPLDKDEHEIMKYLFNKEFNTENPRPYVPGNQGWLDLSPKTQYFILKKKLRREQLKK